MSNKVMTTQEFLDYLEHERNSRSKLRNAYLDTAAKVRRVWRTMRSWPGDIVNVLQRARYGVGYKDMWNAPSYFAGLLAHAAELEQESYTYPGEERGFTGEEWKEYVAQIQADLREYREAFNSTDLAPGWVEDFDAKQEKARAALHRFAAEFEYWGD